MDPALPPAEPDLAIAAISPQPFLSFEAAPVLDFLAAGGPVLYVLAGLSVATLALVFAKTLQFSAARLGERARNGALARILAAADQAAERAEDDHRLIEDSAQRAARLEIRPLEAGLGALAMIAMLSPLIGLLGTVIGMIGAFRALETAGAGVDPSVLSGGIWVALLTTAAGLIVAIPATVAHGWFEGRLNRFADRAEHVIGETVSSRARPARNRLGIAAD